MRFSALAATSLAATLIGLTTGPPTAFAHDARHPGYDAWYDALKRPGSFGSVSCCSRTDCHVTDAEMRGEEWWAKIGVRKLEDGKFLGEWTLTEWQQVPRDKVLQKNDNPTGEAVICHSYPVQNTNSGHVETTIWCFIRPSET